MHDRTHHTTGPPRLRGATLRFIEGRQRVLGRRFTVPTDVDATTQAAVIAEHLDRHRLRQLARALDELADQLDPRRVS